MNARIRVTIADVELAGTLVHGDVSGYREWFAAHLWRRAVGGAEGHQQFAVEGELADGTVSVIDAVD